MMENTCTIEKVKKHYALGTTFFEIECYWCHWITKVWKISKACLHSTTPCTNPDCGANHVVYWQA